MKRKTSIIIVTYNNFDYTKDCIESIDKYTKKNTYEIIVVDNCSTDGTRDWLKDQKSFKVILNEENLGFPKACNQGIDVADRDNDILLLNNDTIVTTNWLKNLRICLESDSNIGAVGSICNHNENEQGCDFSYDDFDSMQRLAKINNVSDQSRWEEKVFLIGFCLLIKREIIDKIKYLDEEYSPGYIEDNDLSLRIIKEGYKLVLCHDSFIHHYLGTAFRKDLNKFYPILEKNREYFLKKWGFSAFCFDEVKNASIKIMENPKKILELNCGISPTIFKIKYQYPNAVIHGVESDLSKYEIAKYSTLIYHSLEDLDHYDYDCILIGDILEKISNPKEFLNHLKGYLSKNGSIIGEINNIASIKGFLSLLNDNFDSVFQAQLHHYTIKDIKILLEEQGYKMDFIFSWYTSVNSEEQELIKKLREIKANDYEVVYYSFRFSRK
ncbi:MAG: glycosyltransferase [Bacilli bacterium]|nr:glycosyltransferase [Bacilli bacterium]